MNNNIVIDENDIFHYLMDQATRIECLSGQTIKQKKETFEEVFLINHNQ